jgi:hypothetical protein
MNRPVPMNLDRFALMIEGAAEFLRLWVRPDGASACFVNPRPLGPDPALFGAMLVDAARQAAKAYAQAVDIDEEEALARIWAGVDTERGAAPIDPISFTRKDS